MLILSKNGDQTSIETVFLIAICRPTGSKWQSKTLFLLIFDRHSLIVDNVFDCHLPGVIIIAFYTLYDVLCFMLSANFFPKAMFS